VEFSFDEPQLLGTAGAIKKALPLLGENFFVLYGDSYLPCDYRKIQTVFEDRGRLALMTVFQNDGRWDRSNVELKGGQILSYDKRNQTPEMRYIDYGLGAFQKAAFQMVPDGPPYDLAKLYRDLLKRNELAAYEAKERFYEIGSFAGLEEFRKYMIAEPIGRPEEPQ
jgi:NDP-sugar pyrophosphorylase family protein